MIASGICADGLSRAAAVTGSANRMRRKLQVRNPCDIMAPSTGSLGIPVPGCAAGTGRLPPSNAAM